MARTSLSYYEKVLKSKVARVRLYPAQDAGAFDCQGAEDRNLLRLHKSCGPAAEKFTIGVVFMNILFFLSPKQDLMYVYDDFTLRQTLEKWENNRYASIPVLNRKGEYVGTLTEGDILWGLKKFHGLDLEAAEDIPIRDFAHKRDYKAVTVTTSMDQLIEAAMNQNFVPVVDDRGMFIGIVRRQAIIRYCYDRSRAAATEQRRKPEKQEKRVPVSAGVQ